MEQKKLKPGKVIRIDPSIWDFVQSKRRGEETISSVLRRLLGLSRRRGWSRRTEDPETKSFFVLPSELSRTAAEARGRAVMLSVRSKSKPEKPIEVREII